MNRHITHLFSLIAVSLLTFPLFASDTPTIAFPAEAIASTNTTIPIAGSGIAIGAPLNSVKKKLGLPMTYLSPNAWLYENVEVTLPGTTQPQSRNLYIVFADEKVASLSIVTNRIRDQLVAKATRESGATEVAGTSANDSSTQSR